jgi:ribosomal protein L10
MQQDLRKRLKEVNAKIFVVKNTLLKLAGKAAKVSKDVLSETVLTGPIAVIIAEEDPIVPLQILGKFAKEFDLPRMKVGIIDGAFQDMDNLITLSNLPDKEVLFAQTVGTIAQPIYGIVGVLNANMQKLIYVLKEASQKGGEN